MRKTIRAIIIKDKKILTIRRKKKGVPTYYVLPGGGVEESDRSLEAAIKRECLEELGVEVSLLSPPWEFSYDLGGFEKTEHFATCSIHSGELGTGSGDEFSKRNSPENSYELCWLEIEELASFNLLPKEIKKTLVENRNDTGN